jgi:short-subunit dehydrogenase
MDLVAVKAFAAAGAVVALTDVAEETVLAAINNACIQSLAVETVDVPSEVFDRIDAINLRGVWACMKYELQHMQSQGSGAIVNNSSLGGLAGVPGRAAYQCRQAWRAGTDQERWA